MPLFSFLQTINFVKVDTKWSLVPGKLHTWIVLRGLLPKELLTFEEPKLSKLLVLIKGGYK